MCRHCQKKMKVLATWQSSSGTAPPCFRFGSAMLRSWAASQGCGCPKLPVPKRSRCAESWLAKLWWDRKMGEQFPKSEADLSNIHHIPVFSLCSQEPETKWEPTWSGHALSNSYQLYFLTPVIMEKKTSNSDQLPDPQQPHRKTGHRAVGTTSLGYKCLKASSFSHNSVVLLNKGCLCC